MALVQKGKSRVTTPALTSSMSFDLTAITSLSLSKHLYTRYMYTVFLHLSTKYSMQWSQHVQVHFTPTNIYFYTLCWLSLRQIKNNVYTVTVDIINIMHVEFTRIQDNNCE
jgi:hypothetical protein